LRLWMTWTERMSRQEKRHSYLSGYGSSPRRRPVKGLCAEGTSPSMKTRRRRSF